MVLPMILVLQYTFWPFSSSIWVPGYLGTWGPHVSWFVLSRPTRRLPPGAFRPSLRSEVAGALLILRSEEGEFAIAAREVLLECRSVFWQDSPRGEKENDGYDSQRVFGNWIILHYKPLVWWVASYYASSRAPIPVMCLVDVSSLAWTVPRGCGGDVRYVLCCPLPPRNRPRWSVLVCLHCIVGSI